MPISRSVRQTRIAISPRFATSTLVNTAPILRFAIGVAGRDGAAGGGGLDQAQHLERLPDRLGLLRRRLGPDADPLVAHSGMLPCLRCGGSTCLPREASRGVVRTGRVRRGAITSST